MVLSLTATEKLELIKKLQQKKSPSKDIKSNAPIIQYKKQELLSLMALNEIQNHI